MGKHRIIMDKETAVLTWRILRSIITGNRTAEEIAKDLGEDVEFIEKVLRLLEHAGIIESEE